MRHPVMDDKTPFSALPVGAVFRFEHAMALGYDELRVKVSDTQVRNVQPTLEHVLYVADADWLTVVASPEEQAEWLSFHEANPMLPPKLKAA